MAIQTAASIADDYLEWEDKEDVTFIEVRQGGTDDPVTGVDAKPLRLRKTDFEILGATGVESEGRVWLLPDALLSGKKPKIGDVITRTSDSTKWILRNVEHIVHDTVWRCLVNKEEA